MGQEWRRLQWNGENMGEVIEDLAPPSTVDYFKYKNIHAAAEKKALEAKTAILPDWAPNGLLVNSGLPTEKLDIFNDAKDALGEGTLVHAYPSIVRNECNIMNDTRDEKGEWWAGTFEFAQAQYKTKDSGFFSNPRKAMKDFQDHWNSLPEQQQQKHTHSLAVEVVQQLDSFIRPPTHPQTKMPDVWPADWPRTEGVPLKHGAFDGAEQLVTAVFAKMNDGVDIVPPPSPEVNLTTKYAPGSIEEFIQTGMKESGETVGDATKALNNAIFSPNGDWIWKQGSAQAFMGSNPDIAGELCSILEERYDTEKRAYITDPALKGYGYDDILPKGCVPREKTPVEFNDENTAECIQLNMFNYLTTGRGVFTGPDEDDNFFKSTFPHWITKPGNQQVEFDDFAGRTNSYATTKNTCEIDDLYPVFAPASYDPYTSITDVTKTGPHTSIPVNPMAGAKASTSTKKVVFPSYVQ